MGRSVFLFALAGPLLGAPVFAMVPAPAQAPVAVTSTEIKGAAPAGTARILKYFLAPAARASGYHTGALHIVYSDGTEVVEDLLPLIKSPPGDFIGNELGFEQVKAAEDGRTLGWLEDYQTPSDSVPLPIVLSLYGSGKTILHVKQGQVVWYWGFQKGGEQVVTAWGEDHGPVVLDYQLYDAATGKLLGEAFGDEKTQSLPDNAPAWAKAAETACGSQCRGPDN